MNKEENFKMTYEGSVFPEVNGVIKILSELFDDEVHCSNIVVSDDEPENDDDKFIMKATFTFAKHDKLVNVYYTYETRMITKIEWC